MRDGGFGDFRDFILTPSRAHDRARKNQKRCQENRQTLQTLLGCEPQAPIKRPPEPGARHPGELRRTIQNSASEHRTHTLGLPRSAPHRTRSVRGARVFGGNSAVFAARWGTACATPPAPEALP
jgi:hypothetical protein